VREAPVMGRCVGDEGGGVEGLVDVGFGGDDEAD
jgi:hypothetical protein